MHRSILLQGVRKLHPNGSSKSDGQPTTAVCMLYKKTTFRTLCEKAERTHFALYCGLKFAKACCYRYIQIDK